MPRILAGVVLRPDEYDISELRMYNTTDPRNPAFIIHALWTPYGSEENGLGRYRAMPTGTDKLEGIQLPYDTDIELSTLAEAIGASILHEAEGAFARPHVPMGNSQLRLVQNPTATGLLG